MEKKQFEKEQLKRAAVLFLLLTVFAAAAIASLTVSAVLPKKICLTAAGLAYLASAVCWFIFNRDKVQTLMDICKQITQWLWPIFLYLAVYCQRTEIFGKTAADIIIVLFIVLSIVRIVFGVIDFVNHDI